MLRDTTLAVVRTRPRAIPLVKITMRKSTHGFPLISIYGMLMGLRLGALRAAGAPLREAGFGNIWGILEIWSMPDSLSLAACMHASLTIGLLPP